MSERLVEIVPFSESFYRRVGFRYLVRCSVAGCLTEDKLSLGNAAMLARGHVGEHEDHTVSILEIA